MVEQKKMITMQKMGSERQITVGPACEKFLKSKGYKLVPDQPKDNTSQPPQK